MRKLFSILILSLIFSGCSITGIKPDYIGPVSGKSFVKLSTKNTGRSEVNRRAYIHGENVCSIDDAGLIGLLNSKTIGLPSVSEKPFRVQSNRELVVSSPSAFLVGIKYNQYKYMVCQPVISFVPLEGETYSVEFNGCKVSSVTDGESNEVKFKEVKSCEVTSRKQSNTKVFWLNEPT